LKIGLEKLLLVSLGLWFHFESRHFLTFFDCIILAQPAWLAHLAQLAQYASGLRLNSLACDLSGSGKSLACD